MFFFALAPSCQGGLTPEEFCSLAWTRKAQIRTSPASSSLLSFETQVCDFGLLSRPDVPGRFQGAGGLTQLTYTQLPAKTSDKKLAMFALPGRPDYARGHAVRARDENSKDSSVSNAACNSEVPALRDPLGTEGRSRELSRRRYRKPLGTGLPQRPLRQV